MNFNEKDFSEWTMDRMRDVPSEEYATLHDVYMMRTSKMVEVTTQKNMV